MNRSISASVRPSALSWRATEARRLSSLTLDVSRYENVYAQLSTSLPAPAATLCAGCTASETEAPPLASAVPALASAVPAFPRRDRFGGSPPPLDNALSPGRCPDLSTTSSRGAMSARFVVGIE